MSNEQKINSNLKKFLKIRNLTKTKNLDNFIGQDNLKSNLKTYIESSKKTKIILTIPYCMVHQVLKTTLAHIISYEKNVNIHSTSGPAFTKKGDLVTLLTNLAEDDILFIDEIQVISNC